MFFRLLLLLLLAAPLSADQLSLTYLGNFSMPNGRQASTVDTPYARFGAGCVAMALSGKAGHLWVSGHPYGDLVAEIQIPEIGGTAKVTTPFAEITSRKLTAENVLDSLVGLAYHNGRLQALWNQFYDVDGVDGGRKSLWNGTDLVQIGDGRIKQTSGYLTVFDDSLWCGRSSGAGNAGVNHGPLLYQIAQDYSTTEHIRDVREDWTAVDQYKAIAFLPGNVCWLVRHATGPVWYGTSIGPNGEEDVWDRSKGYHTTTREAWLLPYSWPGGEAQPIVQLEGFEEAKQVRGMVFDALSQKLYVAENWPSTLQDGAYPGEKPRVHVYQIGTVEPEPEPDPEMHDIEFRLDGKLFRGKVEEIR